AGRFRGGAAAGSGRSRGVKRATLGAGAGVQSVPRHADEHHVKHSSDARRAATDRQHTGQPDHRAGDDQPLRCAVRGRAGSANRKSFERRDIAVEFAVMAFQVSFGGQAIDDIATWSERIPSRLTPERFPRKHGALIGNNAYLAERTITLSGEVVKSSESEFRSYLNSLNWALTNKGRNSLVLRDD